MVASGISRRHCLLNTAFVDAHDGVEELERLIPGTLEAVAPDDGAKAATVTDGTDFIKDSRITLGCATAVDHHAAAIEGGLDHIGYAVGQRIKRDILVFEQLR